MSDQERKPGNSRLVYDKATRTIIADKTRLTNLLEGLRDEAGIDLTEQNKGRDPLCEPKQPSLGRQFKLLEDENITLQAEITEQREELRSLRAIDTERTSEFNTLLLDHGRLTIALRNLIAECDKAGVLAAPVAMANAALRHKP